MNQSDFRLVPFSDKTAPDISITGNVSRQNNQLILKYLLSDNLATVIIPSPAVNPRRQDNLWEHTCFELFFGLKDSGEYWEFNFSPSGNWNIYHFLSYRQNITEEIVFKSLPLLISQQTDTLELNLWVDLDKIIATEQHIEIGVTTVIENQDMQLSYWALNHPATEADFHDRASFLIKL